MIERDYADELGVALVDELMSAVDETIYTRYIERQLVPYTLHNVLSQVLDAADVCILHTTIPIMHHNNVSSGSGPNFLLNKHKCLFYATWMNT